MAASKIEKSTFKYRNFSNDSSRELCSTLESRTEECDFNEEVSPNANTITECIVGLTDIHVSYITISQRR